MQHMMLWAISVLMQGRSGADDGRGCEATRSVALEPLPATIAVTVDDD